MMIDSPDIKPTPWDTAAFNMPMWELQEYSENSLVKHAQLAGHQTLKVDPLSDKKLLDTHGFYYCDTLIEPRCDAANLRTYFHELVAIDKHAPADQLLEICHGAFSHDRFHRDFNLSGDAADVRYDNWLAQLIDINQVYGLYWQEQLAGFIACRDNVLVLHAVAENFRGKSLAKHWWSAVCKDLFDAGITEVRSSISASNLAVLNLYTSLGFSFHSPKDVYHRFVA